MIDRLLLKRAGSVSNYVSGYLRSHFKPVWDVANRFEMLSDLYTLALLRTNDRHIPRIPVMSARNDFPSFDTLYGDATTTYTRLLPRKKIPNLPPVDRVLDLFRRNGRFVPETNRNSSVVFPYYAQWFSHQFFNTNPTQSPNTNCLVGFNLSQLYGTPETEHRLRAGAGGLMRTCTVKGDEYPPLVDNPWPGVLLGEQTFDIPIPLLNLLPGVIAIHTVMLRNHNRNARAIAQRHPNFGDEELFQKAKLISIAQVMKVTMEDYVNNHILSTNVRIRFRPTLLRSSLWRMLKPKDFVPVNCISIEFNVLYRWHQLIPDEIHLIQNFDPTRRYETLDGLAVEKLSPIAPATLLMEKGCETYLGSASLQRAGKLTLLNTSNSLIDRVIKPSLERTRDLEMASYNDYREYFGLQRMSSFEEIVDDPQIVQQIKSTYRTVDDIEYYPGIFAEEKLFGGLHGAILALMGVGSTYAGIFSSRLLLPHVYRPETFSDIGWEIIQATSSLNDLVRWNTRLQECRFAVPDGRVSP